MSFQGGVMERTTRMTKDKLAEMRSTAFRFGDSVELRRIAKIERINFG